MTFVKINKGDTVYDRELKVVGKVESINIKSNTATINALEGNVTVLSNLYHLTIVDGTVVEDEGEPLKIKIKYFNPESTKLSKIVKGDWIDLRAAETIDLKEGEFKLIPLGVAMELPEGFEAHVAPRGSTFKNYGVLESNSVGVVDESYKGDNDQWFMPVLATRDTKIEFDDRICQFRIMEKMPEVVFEEVEVLTNEDRGSHGSTGIK